MIDFPTNPAVDTVVTASNGNKWKWTGTTWELVLSASGASGATGASTAYVDAADALRVLKAGDTMSGHLTLPASPGNAQAVRKDYVDAADALRARGVIGRTISQSDNTGITVTPTGLLFGSFPSVGGWYGGMVQVALGRGSGSSGSEAAIGVTFNGASVTQKTERLSNYWTVSLFPIPPGNYAAGTVNYNISVSAPDGGPIQIGGASYIYSGIWIIDYGKNGV